MSSLNQMSYSQPEQINAIQIIIVIVDVKSDIADDPNDDGVEQMLQYRQASEFLLYYLAVQ